MTIKTYLFDLDDTIISSKIYAEIYLPIFNMIKQKLNLTDDQLEEKAQEFGLHKNRFDRWDSGDLCREFNLLDEYYQVLEEQIQIIPVLHDTIIDIFKQLKSNNKTIAVVSNSMIRTIKAFLSRYELNDYIDFVFSRDDAQCKKRDTKYWKTLIEKHNLVPQECLVIGDDELQDVEVPGTLGFNTLLIENAGDFDKVIQV